MKPRSLLETFIPPSGLQGQVAFLLAMSATRSFLEPAIRTFSGLGRNQRASMGLPLAYLALDAHATEGRNTPFSPLVVPGLIELAPQEAARKGLLHAKLALLAFGRARLGPTTTLRLVVTTGNWTDASARSQLELLWQAEIVCGTRAALAGSDEMDRADVAAAASFVRRVLERYDCPVRSFRGPQFAVRLHDLLDRCSEVTPRGVRPRFIHSLDRPLVEPLRAALKGRRGLNVIVCGSGSFEQPSKKSRRQPKPETLRALESLVPRAEWNSLSVTVEPAAAGALKGWARHAWDDGWTLQEPFDPNSKGQRRTLHAKFVLVGHARGGSLQRGLVYLGSGNLTRRGFLRGLPQMGNIECGLLLEVGGPVRWPHLRQALFTSETQLEARDLSDEAGVEEEPEASGDLIAVSPVRGARLREDAEGRYIEIFWREALAPGQTLVVDLGEERPVDLPIGNSIIRLTSGAVPAVIRIKSSQDAIEWHVAVERGARRIAASAERPQSFDDAMSRLLDFPAAPDASGADEEEAGKEGDGEGGQQADEAGEDGGKGWEEAEEPGKTGKKLHSRIAEEIEQYPLQKAILLIEELGAHQAGIQDYMVDDWLHHLEGALADCFAPNDLKAWRGIGVPFRTALLASGFTPLRMTQEQRIDYRAIVRRFAAAVEGK